MANYREIKDIEYENKYQLYASRLPEFYDRFCSVSVRPTSRATYAYNAYDFFDFLVESNPFFHRGENKAEWIKNITIEDLESITQVDAAEYVKHLNSTHAANTVNAKISAISALYLSLYQLGQIDSNPFIKINRPKLSKKKTIIHMAREEEKLFLDVIKNGTGLTERQKKLQDPTRDLAIFTLFLDTGLRISELVGIDISDIDFYEHSIIVIRKGRSDDNVFMSDNAEQRIKDYMRERQIKLDVKKKKCPALFLNEKLERLSVRSIQVLTKQYKTLAGIDKNISPHKLRATFAMDFIEETSDLLLLQNAMGHANPATTEVYANASKAKQKAARNFRGEEK